MNTNKQEDMAAKLFEIGLALKLNKISLNAVQDNIDPENIDKIISVIEDREIASEGWDSSHITQGQNLKSALSMCGVTQSELAKRLDIPRQKINDLIHGRLTLTVDWAKKIGAALGVSYKNFL